MRDKRFSLLGNILTFGFIAISTGCAPGLGVDFLVPPVEVRESLLSSEDKSELQGLSNLSVRVAGFQDLRSDPTVVRIDGRNVPPRSEIGFLVQEAFEREIRAQGGNLTRFDSPVISGDITDWKVTVEPGFPFSKAHGQASVALTVNDVSGQSLFRANYSGEAESKDPFLGETKIGRVLTLAMSEAVKEALADPQLRSSLLRMGSGQ